MNSLVTSHRVTCIYRRVYATQALMWCITRSTNDLGVLKVLLHAGADVDVRTSDTRRAIDIMRENSTDSKVLNR